MVTANNGFLTIVKQATPSDSTQFRFNLGAGQQFQDGTTFRTITGAGQVQFISMAPGSGYDLSEVVPATWLLSGASCVLQTSPTAGTGTFNTPTIKDFEIRSGLETICTFTNGLRQGTLTGTKVVNRIVTEMAVIDVAPDGLILREIAADTTVDAVIAATGARLTVAEPLGRF